MNHAMNWLPASSVISRRRMIQLLGGGLGSLGLASALGAGIKPALANVPGTNFKPRAKRIIQLFMNGGPFGPDFFDPKPALEKYAGQRPDGSGLRTERVTGGLMPSPFKYSNYGQSGLQVSELLPNFAPLIDDVCILKSVYSNIPNHNPAMYLMNNGSMTPNRPCMGSWLSYGLGTENENLPAYIVLCPGRPVEAPRTWSASFLPGKHQGTYINHSDLDPAKMIPYLKNAKLDRETQLKQLELMNKMNAEHLAARGQDEMLSARIEALETAFNMQTAATDAFDLKRETQATRDAYGTGDFANGCLLSRRLVERGVRMVQLYYGNGQPWDTHKDHDSNVRTLAKDVDQPMAALLTDLKQRGLLEDTLVIWGGEFGRTPVSEMGNGRDHNHWGFTMFMAGGGVKGGMTYGETDEFGFQAVQDKMHIHDLHATILYLMGIDHEKLTYRYAGRDFRLTDVAGNVVKEIVA